MYRDSVTLSAMLETHAREIPTKPALIFHNTTIPYHTLNSTINRLAHALLEMGLKKNDCVGFMLPRTPELVISFLGIIKACGIAAPINFELTAENIKTILDTIRPKCVIVHNLFFNLLMEATPPHLSIKIITVDSNEKKGISWEELTETGNSSNPDLIITPDDIAYLNYTSGSTGNAKGAITTHANIYWNTFAAVDALGLKQGDVHLCMFAPFAHPHEIFSRPLYLGGTMVLVDKIFPKSIAEVIATHKVTCMMGLAPMYENLLDLLEHRQYDFSALRIPESGGMYTRLELQERFRKKLGIPIIPVWGSTETTGIAIANRPGALMPKGSIGKPCATYTVKIVDEHDNELPPEEIGEMIFRGPAVIQKYYGYDADTHNCFRNGWYHSGDLVKKDHEGYYYFIERKVGMMKVAGLKVYPQETERALLEHPGIKEAAVISVQDRLRGEIPKAFIATKNGKELTRKNILKFCRKHLPHYKLPKKIEFRESLPKTGSGKINKNVLKEQECESLDC